MYKSKIIEIFCSLSAVERNRLQKMVDSPYHNQHQEVKDLFDYLCSNTQYRLEEAFKTVFPNQVYRVQKLRNTMSYLQKIIDNFLIYEQLEKEKELAQQTLLKVYRQRKLDKCFESTLRQTKKQREKKSYRDTHFYYLQYELQQEQFLFANEKNRLESKNVQEVLDSFDVFYIANKLKYCVTALTHQNIFSDTYQLHLVEVLLEHVEQHKLFTYPVIAAYYYSYKALCNDDTVSFFELQTLLVTELSIFKKEELKQLYLLAINFCIKQMNMGNEDFTKRLYQLFQSGLDKDIFIENGAISRFTYKNIVATGLKSADYDWVRTFIDDYASYLPATYRQTYVDYNLAKWYYCQQQYERAMPILDKLDNTDRIVTMDAKVTLLKIYYELGNYDALEALLDSFKVYIRRNKELSSYLRKSYLNLIKYLQKVIHLNFYDQQATKKLIAAVQQEQQLPERQWILYLLTNLSR